jgi:outer membrane protein insertion porin family
MNVFVRTLGTWVLTLATAVGGPQAFRLSSIAVTGATRLSTSDITQLSGLKVGQSVAPADLDAATGRLVDTGLFTGVSYKFTTSANALVLTFDVGEQPWETPVFYDNFIGLSDDELTKAVRAEVPTFAGSLPATGGTGLAARALEGVLRAHGLPGSVDYKPLARLDGGGRTHLFSVHNPSPKTCGLHIDGATQVPEAEVVAVARSLIGNDFSLYQFEVFTRSSLIQPYRQHGFWRATFGHPTAAASRADGCDGALVTVHVDEGIAYKWDHAEWNGSTAIAAKDLDAIMAFKAGDVADSRKLEDGLLKVHVAQEKLGYLTARATAAPALNDAAATAVFTISVVEGPQYRMGALTFVGFAPRDVDTLTSKWKLKPGDVYDASYPSTFRLSELKPYTSPPHAVEAATATNTAAHTVDVRFTVK